MPKNWIFPFLLFTSFISTGQSSWKITGNLFSKTEALSFASVYCAPIDTSADLPNILSFSTTDNQGYFELEVDSTLQSVFLVCSYLGYKKKQIKVNRHQEFPMKITLTIDFNELGEIVVTDQILPTYERGDTIVYNASAFRDSTEKTVEELLLKIPGVEIDGAGQIKVNDKPIQKLLIEGTDMFGRQYTIGSQNIPADYIQSIEVIDHYQENQVLKDLKDSEAIVLNLKLKDDVKNRLVGNITAAAGFGDEVKGLGEANIFTISKKQKLLWISNNGNTGDQYGLDALKSTYNFNNTNLLQDPIENSPIFTNEVRPNYLNAKKQLVNNALSTFNTLRSFFDIGGSTKIKLNATFATQKDQQNIFDKTTFLYQTNGYENSNQTYLNFKNQLAKGDFSLEYLQPSNKQSLEFYASYDRNTHDGNKYIDNSNIPNPLFSNATFHHNTLLASAIYTLKLTDNNAISLKGKANYIDNGEIFEGNNEDLSRTLSSLPIFNLLNQNISFKNLATSFTTEYLHRFSFFSLQTSSSIKSTSFEFEKIWQGRLDNLSPSIFTVPFKIKNQKDLTWTNELALSKKISPSWYFQLKGTFFTRKFQQEELITNLNFKDSYTFKIHTDKTFSNYFKLQLSYLINKNDINNHDLLTANFFRNNFNFSSLIPKDHLSGGQNLAIKLSKNNVRKLTSYYVKLIASWKEKLWINDYTFENSIVSTRPVFAEGNQRIRIYGSWDKFLAFAKTNVIFRPRYSIRKSSVVAGSNTSPTTVQNIGASLELAWRLHPTLLFKIESSASKQFYKSEETQQSQLTRINLSPYLLFNTKNWNAQLVFSYSNSYNAAQSAELIGSHISLEKNIKINKWESKVSFKCYNLLNVKNFKSINASEYFIFENRIEAIAPFFLFGFDHRF